MKFEKYLPDERLKPYIRYFVVSENETESEYKVFPSPGLVIGFQYKGQLSTVKENRVSRLDTSGITGITDRYKVFRNSAGIGTILVFFTATGFAHFASHPAHELFGLSVSLDHIFAQHDVAVAEEKLALTVSDRERIMIMEHFFLSQLKDIPADRLIDEAVKLIYHGKGTIRIRALNEQLGISQSPFEKRFRKRVGTTPKKFSSIVRFNTVLGSLNGNHSLTGISYDNNFFDQAHFIKEFKQYTGDTPEKFKRFL